MSLPENFSPDFLPARRIDDAKGVAIAYAVRRADGSMEYKRVRLNKYRKTMSEQDFTAFCNDMIRDINLQLVNSVTPSRNEREMISVRQAMELYIADKERELRPDTIRTYKSFCNIFARWMEQNAPAVRIGGVQKIHAIKFMEYYYANGISNNFYNNNVKWGRCVFGWLCAHCYISGNPFAPIKRKRCEEKKRTLIDAATRQRISEYLMRTEQYGFLLALHLVYSALIRPKEIAQLHVGDVHDMYIVVPADVAKNRHERISAITPAIASLLALLHVDAYPPHYYLLGSGMTPARAAVNIHRFTKKWTVLRDELHLPAEMQLYSLRDSGISDLLRQGVDAISVMHHADHHSLEITTRYANHVDAHLVDIMYNRKSGF